MGRSYFVKGKKNVAKKGSKSKYSRAKSRQQRMTLIITAVIAIIMVLTMVISMLPMPPA